MKLLFDQNLSFKLCTQLADVFPDSSQTRLLGLDQADDRTLWQHAPPMSHQSLAGTVVAAKFLKIISEVLLAREQFRKAGKASINRIAPCVNDTGIR